MRLKNIAYDFGALMTPSFLHPHGEPSRTACSTTWLDGLRGYAALLVFFCHLTFCYLDRTRLVYGTVLPAGTIVANGAFVPEHETIPRGKGWMPSIHSDGSADQNSWLIQLPIVRLIFFGDPMVSIFFIVSGYALSLKPLCLMRRGHAGQSRLLQTLASATFRRPIRLLLPCIVSTFLVLVLVRLGMYNYADKIAGDERVFRLAFRGWAYEAPPFIAATLREQLIDWAFSLYEMMDFVTHFHWTMSRYDIHLWTIPVELRCSLLLYITLTGTALLRSRYRLILVSTFAVLGCSWGDMWEMSLFWSGMFLCELDLIRKERADRGGSAVLVTVEGAARHEREGFQKRWACVLFWSLYLLSFPEIYAEKSYFYYFLSGIYLPGLRIEDRWRFPHVVGSILLILCVSRCKPITSFFSNELARYLGRISYALYLVHGPIVRCLGFTLTHRLWVWMGRGNNDIAMLPTGPYYWAVSLGCIVVIPVVIWVADIFARFVDEPIVRLARALEDKMTDTM